MLDNSDFMVGLPVLVIVLGNLDKQLPLIILIVINNVVVIINIIVSILVWAWLFRASKDEFILTFVTLSE